MTIEPVNDLYSNPKYYEIAFSFRDIKREVSVFEECFRRYSKIPVGRVLDIGCGPSPHLEELTQRGYEYVGLDRNKTALDYAQKKAKAFNAPVTLVQADMRHFQLEKPVDFAFTMLGSLSVETTDDVLSHFAALAQVLNSGGLYFLVWCINFQWDAPSGGDQWTIEKEGVKIDVKFVKESTIDRAAQLCRQKLLAGVNDHGKVLHLETVEVKRIIFPREFLLLVRKSKAFEFIGWWNNWNLDEPIEKAEHIDRPITLIRRL